MTKENIISEYRRVKELLGHQPSKDELFNHSQLNDYIIGKKFGRNAFSKLVEECGDIPKIFLIEKFDTAEVFRQYGRLARKLGTLPVSVEWTLANLKPNLTNLKKSHKIKWSEMPQKFLEFVQQNNVGGWDDVIALIPINNTIEEKHEDTSSGECFVYLMFDTKTNFHKIGISKVAEYREKTLQSEKPSNQPTTPLRSAKRVTRKVV
jgi:hypothetical protein